MAHELMEWRPFREISRLRREMDRLWEDYFGSGRRGLQPRQAEFAPAVDRRDAGMDSHGSLWDRDGRVVFGKWQLEGNGVSAMIR